MIIIILSSLVHSMYPRDTKQFYSRSVVPPEGLNKFNTHTIVRYFCTYIRKIISYQNLQHVGTTFSLLLLICIIKTSCHRRMNPSGIVLMMIILLCVHTSSAYNMLMSR